MKPMALSHIPGVSADDIARIEEIRRTRPNGLTYGMLYSDETFITDSGEISGFSRLLCDHLSNLFGIPVTPVISGWDALIEGLDNHRVDMSGELTSTPERREKYCFSAPIAERTFTVYRRANRPELDLINDRARIRLGFMRGSITFQRVRETCEIPFEPVFFRNYQEAAAAMLDDGIDAFITEGKMESAFEGHAEFMYQEYYPLAYTTVSLSTGNPELYPLIEIFQKYLDAGGQEEIFALHREGNREYLRHKLRKVLNDEEKKFVRHHRQADAGIPVAASFDNYPVSFFDRRTGTWQGVALDVLDEITSLTGLRFDVVNKPDEEWSSILGRLERGEAHVVTHLAKSKKRQGRFIWSAHPYMNDHYALLSRSQTDDVPINRVWKAKVGLVRDTAHEDVFHRIFPSSGNFLIYPDTVSAFEGLEGGETDLLMMTRNLLLSATHYMEKPDFKINVPIGLPCNSYFGLNRDQQTLASIFAKTQKLIDCDGIADKWKRKAFDYRKKFAEARVPYYIQVSLILLLLLLLVVVFYRLRVRDSDMKSMTDHLTGLPNRRSFDRKLSCEWERAVANRWPLNLLMLDVDHFKNFNDSFGHHQGDMVLQHIAVVMTEVLRRKGDMAARYGGEEFCVVLPNTATDAAVNIAEKIRTAVEESSFPCENGIDPLHVTVSIGVAGTKPTPCDVMQDLLSRSDETLYRAKLGGRNRTCVFQAEVNNEPVL